MTNVALDSQKPDTSDRCYNFGGDIRGRKIEICGELQPEGEMPDIDEVNQCMLDANFCK